MTSLSRQFTFSKSKHNYRRDHGYSAPFHSAEFRDDVCSEETRNFRNFCDPKQKDWNGKRDRSICDAQMFRFK